MADSKLEMLHAAILYLSEHQGELEFAVDTTPDGDKPYVFACVIDQDGASAGTVTPVYTGGDPIGAVIRAVDWVRRMVESEANRLDDFGMDAQARCAECGGRLEIVRPGKYQCPACEATAVEKIKP